MNGQILSGSLYALNIGHKDLKANSLINNSKVRKSVTQFIFFEFTDEQEINTISEVD